MPTLSGDPNPDSLTVSPWARVMSNTLDLARWHADIGAFLRAYILSETDWPDLIAHIINWNERQCVTHARPLSLPLLACLTAGGDVESAIPLGAYWRLSLLAARILDDLQDGDGAAAPWNERGARQALPIASGVLAAANLCLTYLPVAGTVLQAVQRRLHTAWLLASRAQSHPPTTRQLDAYFENIIGASGSAFAAVAWSGGRLATDQGDVLELLSALGYNLGLRDAIYSDCRDLREDLGRGLFTLPVIYAGSLTGHPLQARLTALLENSPLTRDDVDEVCRLLDTMQAVDWSYQMARRFHEQASTALHQLPPGTATEWWQHAIDH